VPCHGPRIEHCLQHIEQSLMDRTKVPGGTTDPVRERRAVRCHVNLQSHSRRPLSRNGKRSIRYVAIHLMSPSDLASI
jgi:hypothetical protein